jgi:hypothetical protein
MQQGCQFLRYAFLPCQGTIGASPHPLGLLQRLLVHLCLDIQCVCLWFVLVHKFVAHCVYDTSPTDSAAKLVCTTVTFIVVLNVLTHF